MRTLQDMLLEHHQYASIYRHAYEILEWYDVNDDVAIRLRVAPCHDRHRFNLPTADEVAVILPGVDGDNPQLSERDIVLQNRAGALQIISDLHPAYVPLYYVLLFPYGENGWHPALTLGGSSESNSTAKRLTQTRYVAYRLQVHKNEYSALLRGGRLLQRFMVDMFASIDQSRLLWFRLNQPTIRACLYSGLEDAAAQEDDNVDLHTSVILHWWTASHAATLSGFHGHRTILWTSRHIYDDDYESAVARNYARASFWTNNLR